MYVRLLANLIVQEKPLIYIDETTFRSDAIKSKSWSLDGHPNKHHVTKKQFGCTVYGAIGNCLTEPVYMLGTGTNKEEFRVFLHLVVTKLANFRRACKPFLIYDQHPAHWFQQRRIAAHFVNLPQPSYSSPLNSIEVTYRFLFVCVVTLLFLVADRVGRRQAEVLAAPPQRDRRRHDDEEEVRSASSEESRRRQPARSQHHARQLRQH